MAAAAAPAAPAAAAAAAAPAAAVRADGRTFNQIRAMGCELGLLSRADGSCAYWQDRSKVVAAVFGPTDVPPRKELPDRMTVSVVYKPVTGLPSVRHKAMEASLRHLVEGVVLSTLHPRSALNIIVQEEDCDGSVMSCAVNAVCLALLDAGVPMSACMASLGLSLTADGGLLLDPTAAEERDESASLEFTLVQAADAALGDTEATVLGSNAVGQYSAAQFLSALEAAQAASVAVFAFYRKSIERRLSKEASK